MALTVSDLSGGAPAPMLVPAAGDGAVTIPDAALLFSAEFARDHGDLVLRNAGAPDIRVPGYFAHAAPADLLSPEGAVIRGATVARLAGPEAPGQYAQAGAEAARDPIGQVETLTGGATVQRADGTVETLGPGSKVFPDDVLQTGADGKLAVTFVDGTIFTLSASSRMVVDALIYDPAGQDNFGGFNLIQGSFVFIAGQVARTGGMDVTTPSATMGIKGTTVLVELQTDNGVSTAQVTLLRDPDGRVGRVELFDLSQNLIATIDEANASWIISTVDGETREVERAAGPDDADSVLIAEAVAAYQSAFGRVGQGGTFVELDNVLRGGVGGGAESQDGDGIDLDSDDLEELPELAPPPVAPPAGTDTINEGRNGYTPPPPGTIVVTGDDRGSVADGGSTVADGRLAATEPQTAPTLTWSGSAQGLYGTFTISPGGDWRYVASPAIERLDEGQTAVESFTVTITDGAGRTATQTITITVAGAGDAPVSVTPASEAARTITEAAGGATGGQLAATDRDTGAVLTWSGSAPGTYGTFSVAPGGAWTYVAGAAVRRLAEGQTASEAFTATVTDQTGRTATQVVTVTITGVNDAPVPTTSPAEASGVITDGGTLLAGGRLVAADPDAGAVLTWTGSGIGAFGTFAVLPDGTWTFTGNDAIAALPANAAVTQTFTATVTDDRGATATQAVVVTILGTNDAPVPQAGEFETGKGSAVTGQLVATDVDAGDALTFALGAKGPANGTVVVNADGSFSYTPLPGFQGLNGFDFTVSDGQGGVSTSRATVAVVSGSASAGGSSLSLDITTTPGAQPAGTILSSASAVDATGVNLVVALDRSGSIGAAEWQVQVNQVADALQALAARFAGAATTVDVRVVAYATTASATPTYNLTDPALIAAVRNLPFTGGTTNYAAALTLTEAFFDSQPKGEANFLYFITDGAPTESLWPTVLGRLTNEELKGYTVQIEAFGIGSQINFATLSQLDPTPQLLSGAGALTEAFTATPLFSADLVSLRVELIADGVSRGVIATETSAGVISSGLLTTLSVADIAGIADLLGTSNRISATGGYDLDGNQATVEVELFASTVLQKAAAAQTLTGTTGSDLLFGSDLGDVLNGGAGNDILLGFGGSDVIRPGAGIDTVLAGAGDDRIIIDAPEGPAAGGRELIDGGAGRDRLEIGFGGDVNSGYLDHVDLRGIEVIDMRNGQANSLRLTLSDVLGMSDDTDPMIEALLGRAVPNARTILGDASDVLVLDGAQKTGTAADAAGNSYNIYTFEGGSDVLATLAVDADVTVASQAAVT